MTATHSPSCANGTFGVTHLGLTSNYRQNFEALADMAVSQSAVF
jgi:hypothetical protein